MDLERLLSAKIKEVIASPPWFKSSFPAQTAFIQDTARMKIAQCTRRAGKSYGCGIYLCKTAYENPGVSVLYTALTRQAAERIMWKDILKRINREFNLGCKFNDQDLRMVFPNGSILYLEGADASAEAMNKLLGQKFKLAVIDEASKYRIDVEKLLFDVITPALADYEGTLAMVGTPDNFVNSYFARISQGKIPGWAVHKWTALDNSHMRRQFTAEIKRLKEDNPKVEQEAWFRQNYLGEWVVDDKARVYTGYNQVRNTTDHVPSLPLTYALGVSLSHAGHSAFSVVAYSERSRDAYVVETSYYADNNLTRAVETIHRLISTYDISRISCAEVTRNLADQLRKRYAVPIQEAPEKEKPGLIRIFNDELGLGHIKVLPDNEGLLSEWESIIMDSRIGGSRLEHPACANYLASATLFAWHMCYNYTYQPTTTSDDPFDEYWSRLQERLSDDKASYAEIYDTDA